MAEQPAGDHDGFRVSVFRVGRRIGCGWQGHVPGPVRGAPCPRQRAVVQLDTAATDGQLDPSGLLERVDEVLAAQRIRERRQPVARGSGLFVALGGGELVHPGHQRRHHE